MDIEIVWSKKQKVQDEFLKNRELVGASLQVCYSVPHFKKLFKFPEGNYVHDSAINCATNCTQLSNIGYKQATHRSHSTGWMQPTGNAHHWEPIHQEQHTSPTGAS